jgi:hypothetical protein
LPIFNLIDSKTAFGTWQFPIGNRQLAIGNGFVAQGVLKG